MNAAAVYGERDRRLLLSLHPARCAFASATLRPMDPDDHVCLCFRVSLRKIRTFLRTENPPVASLISDCLSAGTGCMWCVPFLKHLHAQHLRGEEPDLKVSPQRYAEARLTYHRTSERDAGVVTEACEGDASA